MYKKYVKRILDIILSLLAIIILSPLLIIISILVLIFMGRPIIFKQARPGYKNKIFNMIKFRTMTNKKDKNGNLLPDEQRLPKFGKILRSTSLDELPELFDILFGKMSFIGPRPMLVRDMVFFDKEILKRQDVMPGLTGWAQANGRNSLTWDDRFKYDLYYVENLTLLTDIKTIFLTIKTVLSKEGIGEDGGDLSIDYGDYLLKHKRITKKEYDKKQEEANDLLNGIYFRKKEELVSIIMPSYNTDAFISESIESVLNQSYTNWELIIVDDCSNDKTKKVVKKYLKDKRIKYLENKENSGAAISRNKAIKESNGKYIAFLDSDDIWHKDKLLKQIAFMKKNGYDFTYTKYELIDEESKSLNKIVSGPKKISKTGMYNYCWPGCLTVMYNQNKVGLVQIEDLKKNNDYAIWLKVIKNAKCYLLDENLAKYRIRTGSISRNNKIKLIKHHYILYRYGEHRGIIASSILTLRNLFFGVIKKIKYVKILKKNFSIQSAISTMNQSEPQQLLNKMNIKNNYVLINQITNKKLNLINYHSKNGYEVIESLYDSGLSKSRNLAISKIKSNICLICDDDMEYFNNFESKINLAYSKYQDADLIIFDVDFSNTGYTKKIYKPGRIFYLRSMKVSSVQISFKINSINKKNIKYDELFGAGSKFNMGEENIFLFDCLKNNLKIYYVPYTIGKLKVEHDSTWFNGYNKKYFMSRGASFYRMSKLVYIILIIQFAVRRRKLFDIGTTKAIKYMFLGVREYKKKFGDNK